MGVGVIDPLNFSESGWWGRILSEMKVLIPILIGLLVVGCGKKTSKPEATTSKGDDNNSTEIQTRKLTAEEEKVVGEYGRETNQFGDTKK